MNLIGGKRHMLKGRPLKTRLKGMLLLFSLLPCCGLGLALTGMSWRSYLKNLGKENQAVLTALRNDVQVMESQAESLVNTLASDSTVLSLLTPSEGLADRMMHSSGVQRELMIVKASLSVFDANFVLIYLDDAKLEHWSTVLSASRYQNDPAFAAFLSADRVGQWHGLADLLPKAVSKLNEFSGMEEQYLFDRKVYSSAGKLVGVIRLGIDIRGLLKDAQAASGSLLFYAQGQSVFPTEMAEPDAGLFQSGQYRGGGKLWQRLELDQDGLTAYTCADLPAVFSAFLLSALPFVLLFLFAVFGMYLLSSHLLNEMLNRLNQTTKAVNHITEEDYHIALPQEGTDEVGSLVKAYNLLVTRLDQQKERLLQEERAKRELQSLALQYQLNPHFLFNSLQWLEVEIENAEEAARLPEAISRLGVILRYNLSDSPMSTLQQERAQMYAYVDFMSVMKRQNIQIDIRWDPALDQAKLLRFTFQPILENAIRHGLIRSKPLHLAVSAEAEESALVIRISNDGRPIAPDKLEEMRRACANPAEWQSGSVGLRNLVKRLTLHYAGHYSLEVKSDESNTEFQLRIPLERGDTP